MLPPAPPLASPLDKDIPPVLPTLEVPVVIATRPLTPAIPAFGVAILMPPLDVDALKPLARSICCGKF